MLFISRRVRYQSKGKQIFKDRVNNKRYREPVRFTVSRLTYKFHFKATNNNEAFVILILLNNNNNNIIMIIIIIYMLLVMIIIFSLDGWIDMDMDLMNTFSKYVCNR